MQIASFAMIMLITVSSTYKQTKQHTNKQVPHISVKRTICLDLPGRQNIQTKQRIDKVSLTVTDALTCSLNPRKPIIDFHLNGRKIFFTLVSLHIIT